MQTERTYQAQPDTTHYFLPRQKVVSEDGGVTSLQKLLYKAFRQATGIDWIETEINTHVETMAQTLLSVGRLGDVLKAGCDILYSPSTRHDLVRTDVFKSELNRVVEACGISGLKAETTARLTGEIAGVDLKVEIDSGSLTLKLDANPVDFSRTALLKKYNLEDEFTQLEQGVKAVKDRWHAYFLGASNGVIESISFLTEGIWASKIIDDLDVKRDDLYARKPSNYMDDVKKIDTFKGRINKWREARYKDPIDRQIFRFLGLRGNIKDAATLPSQRAVEIIMKDPDQIKDFGSFIQKEVQSAMTTSDSISAGVCLKDTSFWQVQIARYDDSIEKAIAFSKIGWALENKTRIIAQEAARKGDIRPALYHFFRECKPQWVIIKDNGLTFEIDAKNGMEVAFGNLEKVLEQFSDYVRVDLSLKFPYEHVNWPVEEIKKVLEIQTDIKLKSHDLHFSGELKDALEKIKVDGKGFLYMYGPKGWGKTQTMAYIISELQGGRFGRQVEVYTLKSGERTPENLIKAMKYMNLLIAQSLDTALVVDDVHTIEEQMTMSQYGEYLDAFTKLRNAADKRKGGYGGIFFMGEMPPLRTAQDTGHRLEGKFMVTYTDDQKHNWEEIVGFLKMHDLIKEIDPKNNKQRNELIWWYAHVITQGAITDKEYEMAMDNAYDAGIALTKRRVEFSQFLTPGWVINHYDDKIAALLAGKDLNQIKREVWDEAHTQVVGSRAEYEGSLRARMKKGFGFRESLSVLTERRRPPILSESDFQLIVRAAAAEAGKNIGAIVAREVKAATAPLLMQIAMLYADSDVMRTLLLGSGNVSELLPLPEDRLARLVPSAKYADGRTVGQEFKSRKERYKSEGSWEKVEHPLINREGSFSREYWTMKRPANEYPSRVMGITLAVLESMGFTVTAGDIAKVQPLVNRIILLGMEAGYVSNMPDVNMLRFVSDCIKEILV